MFISATSGPPTSRHHYARPQPAAINQRAVCRGDFAEMLAVRALGQSVFGRLAGYEDASDADRLSRDPAMRWVVGGRAITGSAA
jgi:hypothetical protein